MKKLELNNWKLRGYFNCDPLFARSRETNAMTRGVTFDMDIETPHDLYADLEKYGYIEDLGYASCWVEGHVTGTDQIGEKMAAMLGVPDDYELICYLPVGIPAEEYKIVEKKPFEERAWFNGFGK